MNAVITMENAVQRLALFMCEGHNEAYYGMQEVLNRICRAYYRRMYDSFKCLTLTSYIECGYNTDPNIMGIQHGRICLYMQYKPHKNRATYYEGSHLIIYVTLRTAMCKYSINVKLPNGDSYTHGSDVELDVEHLASVMREQTTVCDNIVAEHIGVYESWLGPQRGYISHQS